MNHQGWNSHVDGAIALLKARGPEEFQSPVGREMWHCVRALAVSLPSLGNLGRLLLTAPDDTTYCQFKSR